MRLICTRDEMGQARPLVRALQLPGGGGRGAGAWRQGISAEKGPVISLRLWGQCHLPESLPTAFL